MTTTEIEDEAIAIAGPAHLEADEIFTGLAGLEVGDRDDATTLAQIAADCKARREDIDEQRKRITTPLREALAEVNGLFKPAIETLQKTETAIKALIVAWRQHSIDEGDRLLESAGLLGNPDDITRAVTLRGAPDKIPGVQIRRTWSGSVIDADAIPRAFMVPDVKALEQMTKAANGRPQIPGWAPEEKTTIALIKPNGGA